MGLIKYTITVESDTPPNISIGQELGGAVVKELKELEDVLVSASQLAKKYSLSVPTIRDRLVSINQGTTGKALYNPRQAHELLIATSKIGRPRAN